MAKCSRLEIRSRRESVGAMLSSFLGPANAALHWYRMTKAVTPKSSVRDSIHIRKAQNVTLNCPQQQHCAEVHLVSYAPTEAAKEWRPE